jgi:hypothetical protein
MPDKNDPWALLREKRRKKSSDHRAPAKKRAVVPPPNRSGALSRTEKPKKSGLLAREHATIAPALPTRPGPSAVLVRPGASGKRKRHLVHVDMVSAENRDAVEAAAKADGRTLSQWCRILLLRAAQREL